MIFRTIEFILSPKLKFELSEYRFKITNDEYSDESGEFEYKNVESLELKKGGTSLVATFLSVVFETIFLNGFGNSYKSKQKLVFKYAGTTKKISLGECDETILKNLLERLYKEI